MYDIIACASDHARAHAATVDDGAYMFCPADHAHAHAPPARWSSSAPAPPVLPVMPVWSLAPWLRIVDIIFAHSPFRGVRLRWGCGVREGSGFGDQLLRVASG